ncbi:MAG TPA: ferritin family protein [Acidobacteriota bacterium]
MNFKTVQEVIAFAVQREEEAAHSYGRMMGLAQAESSKLFLADLKKDEENHKRMLLDLSRTDVTSLRIPKVADLKISDYLVAEPLQADMSFQDLLIFAAKKEQKAVDLYIVLMDRVPSPEQKKLFEFLSMQEKTHKLKLEAEYERRVLQED